MRSIVITILMVGLFGCTHNAAKVTGNPSKSITLEEAFRSVGASMKALEEAKGDKALGVAISEINVTFNISSKATDTGKLGATVGVSSPEIGTSANLNAEVGTTMEGNRSNVIVVKLQALPAFLNGLDKEKMDLLERVGYFRKNQIPIGNNPIFFMTPEGLSQVRSESGQSVIFSEPQELDPETKKRIMDALNKGAE